MIEKIKIPQVVVVEGRDDTANLKRYFDVETYETRGSAISDADIERIRRLQDLHGVIVFTDPDFNGERIRRLIMTEIPAVQHAFLKRDEAAPKSKTKGRSLGIDSRQRREYLGEQLRIGYSNGKQLLKRLELFGVTLAEVEEVMTDY